MKKILGLLLILFLGIQTSTFAQLPDGATAPDFTLTDINGNTHHLYSLLDQGKMVVLEFSATWCGPCWNYMLTGALEDFWNEYGPNGTNQAQVFYIEADFSTGMADLLGLTASSQGNWVANIPFPIIDLQPGQNTANDYDINYYPTLYAVCSDHTVYELGQVGANQWAEFLTSCTLAAEVAEVVPADCYGTGSVTVEASGGITPITYHWSNGQNGPTLSNVGAGTYSVTVTEDNGKFVVIEDIVVTGQDAPMSLASSEVEDVLCNGTPTGSISIQIAEGTPPFSYDWSNGSHLQNLVNVQANEYGVTVTDDNGCEFEAEFEIEEPDAIEVVSTLTPDYCDQGNGSISLDIDGGVGGYEITASNGTIFGNNILDIPAGVVNVEVEDNNGCLWLDDYTIEAEDAPNLFFTPSPQLTCIQPTTIVTGYLDGGSGDFSYQWTTTNGHIVGPANQEFITVDQPGDYSLEVEDLFTGCAVNNEVGVVSQINLPIASAGDDAPVSCENLQLTLSGTGDTNFSVTWSTVNGHIVSGANTYNPIVDAPGDYSMTVLNPSNSCATTDAMVVLNDLQPAQASYSFQTSGLTMLGNDQSSGSNVTGWAWTFGDGGSSNEPNAVHTYAAPGTYDVCLSVQNGCGVNQSCQQVTVSFTGSVLTVNPVITNCSCFGDTTGQIVLVVNGGSGVYTYLWSGPNGTEYSTPDLINVGAGTYQVVINDDAGNVFINEYIIGEPAPLAQTDTAIVDNLCFGELNGSLTINMIGGVGPYQYSFNGGPNQAENFISNQASGDYLCMVTDSNGCAFQAGPFLIGQPADITYQSIQTNVRCFGESNGAISLTVGGGVAPYTFLWSNGESAATELSNLTAGQYTCIVTDQHGCIDNILFNVAQPEVLEVDSVKVLDATGPTQSDGSVTIYPVGGTAPYTISWSNGATGDKAEGLLPGEYTYSILDAHGCTYTSAPVLVGSGVATTRIDWSRNISITPNPSDGKVVVSWHDLSLNGGNISLLTLEGNRISSAALQSSSGIWDLSAINLQGGVYLVVFQFDHQSVPLKLVVVD